MCLSIYETIFFIYLSVCLSICLINTFKAKQTSKNKMCCNLQMPGDKKIQKTHLKKLLIFGGRGGAFMGSVVHFFNASCCLLGTFAPVLSERHTFSRTCEDAAITVLSMFSIIMVLLSPHFYIYLSIFPFLEI